jgi:hypothetical protein
MYDQYFEWPSPTFERFAKLVLELPVPTACPTSLAFCLQMVAWLSSAWRTETPLRGGVENPTYRNLFPSPSMTAKGFSFQSIPCTVLFCHLFGPPGCPIIDPHTMGRGIPACRGHSWLMLVFSPSTLVDMPVMTVSSVNQDSANVRSPSSPTVNY